MKYRDSQELADSLDELSHFIRENGHKIKHTKINVYVSGWVYPEYDEEYEPIPESSAKKMGELAKVLAPVEKVWQKDYLDLVRKFGSIQLKITANRKGVCTKKVVDTIEHPETVVQAWTEEVIEWECKESLLA